ncbi:MAG: hypothetical protein FWB77_02485 [Treponema sp.]|nr:hypothetical protein [Treponema sp.]
MRKVLFGVCLIVVVAFVFGGCASTKVAFYYDPEISEELTSYLWVPSYVLVKKFGDKEVRWVAPPNALAPVLCAVPYGEQIFVVDIAAMEAVELRAQSNKTFTNNFEAGKGYQLYAQKGEVILIPLK